MERNHCPEVLKAVAECYNSKPINELVSKFDQKELQQDLKQEMFLYVLERPESQLKGLFERGELLHFMLYIIKRNMTSTKSKFYRLQRKETGVEIPTTYEGFSALDADGRVEVEQANQDLEAEKRFGCGFIDYVYRHIPKLGEPKKQLFTQTELWAQ